ncbi:MAG: Uma2 family endonuclease [Deltaproteobacteria bacterium]|nr:Uma2 family endonuclease [Deltaproteobacteria bacterium]
MRERGSRGPFRADQLRDGDSYELTRGNPVFCAPTGHRGSVANVLGAEVLDTDPDVERAGVDAGFCPEPGTLRAPDVAVGNVGESPGWGPGAPVLALEYADTGQDEEQLQTKIADLLGAGTRWVWVVRLVGPRRVEVYERGAPPRTMGPGALLEAPGILRNAVAVEALFDRDAAHEATLRNLLQRRGYGNLDAVRQEGRVAQARAALLAVVASRGLALDDAQRELVASCSDVEVLSRWHLAAVTAATADTIFAS